MAEDARTRYTKHMIEQAFIGLVKEKPFSRIRLKEVCERAGINHSTFYRYYKDIYDWKEQLEQSCIDHTYEIVSHADYNNLKVSFLDLFYGFRDSKGVYGTNKSLIRIKSMYTGVRVP